MRVKCAYCEDVIHPVDGVCVDELFMCFGCDSMRLNNELVQCASCGDWLRFNSEDLMNTTCMKCGGEAK